MAHAVFSQTAREKIQYDFYLDGVQMNECRFTGFEDRADVAIHQTNGAMSIVPLTELGAIFCALFGY